MNKNTDNITATIKSEERDFAWMMLVICTPIVVVFLIALGAPMGALLYAAALEVPFIAGWLIAMRQHRKAAEKLPFPTF